MMVQCPNVNCPSGPDREFKNLNALLNHAKSLRKNGYPWCQHALEVRLIIIPKSRNRLLEWFSNPINAFFIGSMAAYGTMLLIYYLGPHLCAGYTFWDGCGWFKW